MSHRLFAVLMAIGVLAASNAFASRATNLVTGTGDAGLILGSNGDNGSLAFSDPYNIFYNPAYVNDFKNWAIIEKSNGFGTAEGGFVANIMNFNVGFFMNRVSSIAGSYTTAENMRPFDIMIGSDMGVKWGLGLSTGYNAAGPNTDEDMTLHLGASFMDIEPFVAIKIIGNDEQSNPGTTEKNSSQEIGVRYHWGEWTPYFAYLNLSENPGVSFTAYRAWGVGLARTAKVAEGVRMDYAVSYFSVNGADDTDRVIPIDFSVEGDAASWLTLRAGVNYHLYDRSGGNTNVDGTTGRIGASIHAGKVDIDFAMGKGTVSAATEQGYDYAPPAKPVGNGVDAPALDVSNGFFTAASVGYHW